MNKKSPLKAFFTKIKRVCIIKKLSLSFKTPLARGKIFLGDNKEDLKMKVILQEDVKKVGAKGEVVEVSDGYGRNYLLPRKLAVEANVANLNSAKVKAENKARKLQREADEAKLLGAQLEKISVKIPVKIGKDGKLFGSVSGSDVAKALKENHSLNVDKRKISIQGNVTGAGIYDAVIKLHPEVTTKIKIEVTEG